MQKESSQAENFTTSIAIPVNCTNPDDADPSKITWEKDESKNYWIAASLTSGYIGCTFKEAKLYLPDNIKPDQPNIWTKNTNDTNKWDLTYIQDIDGGKRKSKKNKRKSKSRKSKKARKGKSRKSKKSKSHKK
jgi:hypothetical protein